MNCGGWPGAALAGALELLYPNTYFIYFLGVDSSTLLCMDEEPDSYMNSVVVLPYEQNVVIYKLNSPETNLHNSY